MNILILIIIAIFGVAIGYLLTYAFFKKDVSINDQYGNELRLSFWSNQSVKDFEDLVRIFEEEVNKRSSNGNTD